MTGAAKADVDDILYVPASLALHQRPGVPGIRSTFGTGTELLKAGLSRLDFGNGDRMFLEVREGNEKARRFYEHHGFEAFGKRNNYYADGETAILYRKTT